MQYNSNISIANLWSSVDYLLTGEQKYIQHMLKPYLDAHNDPNDALTHRIRNLWVPMQYSKEHRRLISQIIGSLFFTGVDDSSMVTARISFFSFLQESFESAISYGGSASVIIPASKDTPYILKHVDGKNINDVVTSPDTDEIQYLSWSEPVKYIKHNADKSVISSFIKTHYFYVNGHDVYYYSDAGDEYQSYISRNSFVPSKGVKTSFNRIPCVGVNTSRQNNLHFRGSPYLFALASACLKASFSAAKLDYLIDFILPPVLIHKGSILTDISNSDWRGVNIGANDDLEYLQYKGDSLNAAASQLNRYSQEISDFLPSLQNRTKTAFEAEIIADEYDTIRVFVLERFITYARQIIALSQPYNCISNIDYDTFNIATNFGLHNRRIRDSLDRIDKIKTGIQPFAT